MCEYVSLKLVAEKQVTIVSIPVVICIFVSVVEETYRMKFPVDFELFWKFCLSISPNNPKYALKETLGLNLAGPFDVLDGKTVAEPCLHSR